MEKNSGGSHLLGILFAVLVAFNTNVYIKYKTQLKINGKNINSIKTLRQELMESKKTLEEQKDITGQKDEIIKAKEEEISKLKKKIEQSKKSNTSVSRGMSNKKLLGVFEATAYDDSPQSQGKWVGQTATGMKPQRGVIAVDPKIIPLGTKLYVEGYGECVAGDTGGAIKGRRLDLFMDTRKECYDWGRRKVKVYLISN